MGGEADCLGGTGGADPLLLTSGFRLFLITLMLGLVCIVWWNEKQLVVTSSLAGELGVDLNEPVGDGCHSQSLAVTSKSLWLEDLLLIDWMREVEL